ncbi:hypothetical protein AFCDBAGC_1677 [Methylobacterium cerastii]|uniref:Uncharacterized protein n=1 Tax=Methylobacterium cerastii TaxID=932741 RepID=A0ABQ4QGE5_9HYPH|nr:hypothetical protein [Methylobacterium cerastii]GJD43819.1 hypothetical protein AFCDBAGC_1677 [Methylobacterium cerastii]
MKRLAMITAVAITLTLSMAPKLTHADDGDRSFLMCEGASQKDQGQTLAFPVTLDVAAGKVLAMISGDGATTTTFTDAEIGAKQAVGSGVENVLQIDRITGGFTLTITHSVKDGEAPAETDDAFRGTCRTAAKAF